MYRVLVHRQVASSTGKNAVRIVRRRLATEAAPEPPQKKHVFRRIIWTTVALTGTFYVGSSFVAFNSQTYYDLFSDRVPLGQSMLEFAEARGWDTLTLKDVVEASQSAVVTTRRFLEDTIGGKSTTPETDRSKTLSSSRTTVMAPIEVPKIQTKSFGTEPKRSEKKEASRNSKPKFSSDVQALVDKAEAALAKHATPPTPTVASNVSPTAPTQEPTIEATQTSSDVYDAPLPVGFEPPPGYKRPSAKKPEAVEAKPTKPEPVPVKLPVIAPSVAALNETEPIISHLANTIDNLATYIEANPSSAIKAADVLEEAKVELTSLAERIEKVKEEERSALEAKMDEQTREYSLKLIELELESQDKLDNQEEEFKQFFEQERARTVEAYREKLEQELKTQMELINERLKQEVIAQGVELQRRWIREIKVRVEEERGGRLAKLEELSANLKRLEQVALGNAEILEDTTRIHALWSAARALTTTALASSERRPFRDELRVLRHIAAAREDELVTAVLDTLETSDVPDIGVEPLPDLITWFTTSVSPKIARVALVPDQDAGVLSYLGSYAFSAFRFKPHGLVEGDDVLSMLARAEHYLNEKDLDSAARELNQLKGPAKTLIHDWLEAARRRLEVEQALDIVQSQATIASLLIL